MKEGKFPPLTTKCVHMYSVQCSCNDVLYSCQYLRDAVTSCYEYKGQVSMLLILAILANEIRMLILISTQ